MRTESSMPIVIRIDEPFKESFDEPFDLDREVRAYVHDVAQFTLQRLKQHLDDEESHQETFLHDEADAA
jgi:hypothetical protein